MTGQDTSARDLKWLIAGLADDVPGVRDVVLVSSDGLVLASAHGAAGDARAPKTVKDRNGSSGRAAGDGPDRLGAIVSGLVSLAQGAARILDMGQIRQQIVTMSDGHVVAMSISDGSCLGVHATATADLGVVAYQMTTFVRRAGHVLTPALRAQMHREREGGGGTVDA